MVRQQRPRRDVQPCLFSGEKLRSPKTVRVVLRSNRNGPSRAPALFTFAGSSAGVFSGEAERSKAGDSGNIMQQLVSCECVNNL